MQIFLNIVEWVKVARIAFGQVSMSSLIYGGLLHSLADWISVANIIDYLIISEYWRIKDSSLSRGQKVWHWSYGLLTCWLNCYDIDNILHLSLQFNILVWVNFPESVQQEPRDSLSFFGRYDWLFHLFDWLHHRIFYNFISTHFNDWAIC